MKIRRSHSPLQLVLLAVIFLFVSPSPRAIAIESPLQIETKAEVDSKGKVALTLTFHNRGTAPVFHIHPMLHFHHSMAMLPAIHKLDPGQTVVIKNNEHPPVRMPGSYPIVAMVSFKSSPDSGTTESQVHTSSFYFKEAMPSQIEGSIVASKGEDKSLLKVVLKNVTPSFKNIRLMLVLPPEIHSGSFQGMKGFTLRAGEEKSFEIPVEKLSGIPGGLFPVHLLVEYGQMVKHYSGDITGMIDFRSFWGEGPIWPHFLVVLFLTYTIYVSLRRRKIQKPAALSL